MTLQEFNEINWHRGNIVKLQNGKEYLVKGVKAHGRYLLLYTYEYEKCFVVDHRIVDSRTSDYEEPEEVYLERKRRKQEEAEAQRMAERLARRKAREERKQRNLQEQERIHQEALARKAAARQQALAEKARAKAKADPKPAPKPAPKPEPQPVAKAEPTATSEPAPEQPKRKRLHIKVNRAEKVKF